MPSDIPEKILHPWKHEQKKKRRKKKVIILIVLIFISFLGYQNRDMLKSELDKFASEFNFSETEMPKIAIRKPELDLLQMEKEIHNLINEERTKRGLSTLSWNDELADIARTHSTDMAINNYFSHDDLQDRDMEYRYNQAGFRCSVPTGQGSFALGGENIFQNNLYDSITYINGIPTYHWNSQEKIAESTVEGWMDSTGHRENILTSFWTSEGIGVAISSDDKVLITQNFC